MTGGGLFRDSREYRSQGGWEGVILKGAGLEKGATCIPNREYFMGKLQG